MKQVSSTLPRKLIECFQGRMLIGHMAAILLTVAIVLTGLDWHYFQWMR